ncbi:MAG: hypothetical protein HYT37_01810 [Candidatus Sungbacteria bacterium]|nr:hypothetical protein [Candidatus Sungbacteria bacterium]
MSIIVGHHRQREYLNKVIKRGRLAHAYLFSGPEGAGKLRIANTLAKSFFCDKKQDRFESACERCVPCMQIEEHRHGNTFFLDTKHALVSEKEKRKDIPIEDIRELKRQFALSGPNGEWRVVIVNEAEKLNGESASAFLKLLEEPAPYSLFLLVTAHEGLLMETIRSRAQSVRFGLVGKEDLLFFAEKAGLSGARLERAVWLAEGRPEVLTRLCADSAFFESAEKKAKFMDQILRAPIPDILRAAERIAEDPEKKKDAVRFLFVALRNMLYRQDAAPRIKTLVSVLKKADRIQYLMETTNVNPRLALDVLFLEARRVYTG